MRDAPRVTSQKDFLQNIPQITGFNVHVCQTSTCCNFHRALIHKYRQYNLGNPLKRPDMQLNMPGTLHCSKVSLNRDRLLQGHKFYIINGFVQLVFPSFLPILLKAIKREYYTQGCFRIVLRSLRVVESTTSYTFPVQTGGIFYFPWHRHQIERTDGL